MRQKQMRGEFKLSIFQGGTADKNPINLLAEDAGFFSSLLVFFRFETRVGVTKAGAPRETDAFERLEVFAELVKGGW